MLAEPRRFDPERILAVLERHRVDYILVGGFASQLHGARRQTYDIDFVPAAGVTGSAWLLVAGYAAHGVKDLWQHRTLFVTGTRWRPPFCATIDFLVAVVLSVGIAVGVSLH